MAFLKERKKKFKNLKQPVLIVCEDSKSSVYYLKKKVRSKGLNPDDVHVSGDSDSSPISVVDFAIATRDKRKKSAKREGTLEYKEVYCVMDVDEHPTLRNAIIKARGNGLMPIVSNESFELWYLLHFTNYSTAFKDRVILNKELSTYIKKNYDKGDDCMFELLTKNGGSEANALNIAQRLDESARAESEQRDPLRNPSTEVYILINKINNFNKK
ncbi:MAG: RloB family protein [Bacteroidota bacterium]|nr:RloB family protein [Bacteroidota bacterium]